MKKTERLLEEGRACMKGTERPKNGPEVGEKKRKWLPFNDGEKAYYFSHLLLILICIGFLAVSGCGAKSGGTGGTGDVITEENGTYTPSDFHFTGGTGRVQITCPEVTKDGDTYTAKLVFDSKNYQYIKVAGKQYDRDASSGEDNSIFFVPIEPDKDIKIMGLTTAMSTAHEVEYTIFVSSIGTAVTEGSATVETVDEGEESSGLGLAAGVTFADPENLAGLTYEKKMDLSYAKGFAVHYYKEGYKLIEVYDSAQYLLVPEGKEAPEGISEDIVILQQPLDHIYLAATSAMSLFFAMGGQDAITLSGTDASGWHIEGPGEAIKAGKMQYAGKYSAPDYELMVGSGCNLAIESTMIFHSPDVKEKIEELGIPVFVDASSYEMEPLGRTEWIKLYGAMLNKETDAEAFFAEQDKKVKATIEAVQKNADKTGKTVAVFSLTTSGTVTVRRSDDYIPRMISIAGGKYIFDNLTSDSRGGTQTISMEEFYSTASEADFLIYNATIEMPLKDIDDLKGKDGLFADFKAVQEGNVWQIGKDLYQATDIVGQMTEDLHIMLTDGDESGMTFLEKLK